MTDLSPTTIAALAAAGAILIPLFFAGVVSMITAWRAVASKVSAIEAHVNSEKTAAEGRAETMAKENTLLREMLEERKQTAALLAQSAATTVTEIVTKETVNGTAPPVTPKGQA